MAYWNKIYEFVLHNDNDVANSIARKLLLNMMLLLVISFGFNIALILFTLYVIFLQPPHQFLELLVLIIAPIIFCKNVIKYIGGVFNECKKLYDDYRTDQLLDKLFNNIKDD